MKRKLFLFGLIVGGMALLPFHVQAQRRDKMDAALRSFTDTEFMKKFKELRLEAENIVLTFKEQGAGYSAADVNRVKTAYERTADKFNNQLMEMKADFMNERKLKYIQDFPDDYANSLSMDINGLTSFYQSNLQSTIQDVSNADMDGNSLLLLVAELAKLAPDVVANISEIRNSVKQFDEQFLDDNLVKPYKFKRWDEISF
ncbi:MAG: hypothetical protein ACKOAY_13075 [Haliscomenobacter sp.]